MTDHLAQSIELAARVHRGRVDKGGQPYILHSLHVMYAALSAFETEQESSEMRMRPDNEALMCAAVLHDAVGDAKPEDRPKRRCEVYEAAGDRAGEAVDALTRGIQESWSNYIDRVCKDWIARLVKIEDLRHNMDLTRLGRDPEPADLQRQRKYMDAEVLLVEYERSHAHSVGASK